jgi:hypothetical protein
MDGLEVNHQDQAHGKIYVPPSNAYGVPDGTVQSPPSRIPFGLSVLVYTILVASLTMAITGAAVGGGLGSAVADHKRYTLVIELPNAGRVI